MPIRRGVVMLTISALTPRHFARLPGRSSVLIARRLSSSHSVMVRCVVRRITRATFLACAVPSSKSLASCHVVCGFVTSAVINLLSLVDGGSRPQADTKTGKAEALEQLVGAALLRQVAQHADRLLFGQPFRPGDQFRVDQHPGTW